MNSNIAISPSVGIPVEGEKDEITYSEVVRLDDSEIIDMLFDRDESALTALSRKYGSYCTSIANNILRGVRKRYLYENMGIHSARKAQDTFRVSREDNPKSGDRQIQARSFGEARRRRYGAYFRGA